MASFSQALGIFETRAFEFDGIFNLFLVQYKLHKLHVNGIVQFTDEKLSAETQIAKDIAKSGGEDYRTECRKLLARFGELSVLNVAKTTEGDLPCDAVLHSICPFLLDHKQEIEFETGLKLMEQAFDRVFKSIKDAELDSVAIPLPHFTCRTNDLLVPTSILNFFLNGSMRKRAHPRRVFLVDQSTDTLVALASLLAQGELRTSTGSTVYITELDESMVANDLRGRMILPQIYPKTDDEDGSSGEEDEDKDYLHPLEEKNAAIEDKQESKKKKWKMPIFRKLSISKIVKRSKNRKKSIEEVTTPPEPHINAPRYSALPEGSQPCSTWKNVGFDLNGSCNIYVVKGIMTSQNVTAVINDTDEHLIHMSAESDWLSLKAGPEYIADCNAYVMENGPLDMSNVAVTTGGDLPCQYVLNVTCDRQVVSENTVEELRSMYAKVFETADNIKGMRNLALFPIGYDAGLPRSDVVLALYQSLVEYSTTTPAGVAEIFLVVKDDVGVLLSLVALLSQETVISGSGRHVISSRLH